MHEDYFLKGTLGKCLPRLGYDFTLGTYINLLRFPQVVIFHSQFSNDNESFALLAIKTLSRNLGGYHIRLNAEKAIFLEQ